MDSTTESRGRKGAGRVRIWDLPTRLFHWALVALVTISVVTAKLGGLWLDWHMRSGYAILALLVFRLLWGIAGGRYARFAHFVRGPRIVLAYLQGRHPHDGAGHNPLGALSVVVILAVLLLQAVTGLFATDDIASEGPLMKLVPSSTGALVTRVHRWNQKILLALIMLHVATVLYYLLVRRRNLIVPMLTGDQYLHGATSAEDDRATRIRATLLLAIAAALVGYVVNL